MPLLIYTLNKQSIMNKCFKTVKKLALILTVGCLSFTAMANTAPGDEDANLSMAPSEKTGSVVVRAWNLEANAPATIKVVNKFGTPVYQEALATGEDHLKKYDFSQMKAGRYSLVLESQTGEVARKFVVGMNGVVREDETETLANFIPVIKEKHDQKCVQVMFNNPAKAPLTVELLDDNYKVVYSEKALGRQAFGKSIKMKKLPKGTYKVRVSNNDYQYTVDVRR